MHISSWKLKHSSAILQLLQKHENLCLGLIFFRLMWIFCGQFCCQQQTVAWQILCFSPITSWWEPAFDLSSVFCSWRIRFQGKCVLVITRQFEPSAEGSQRSAWCSLSQWVEMNNPHSLSGSLQPPRISLFLNAECTCHGLRLQCLFVTWPLSASTHNLVVCEIRYGCRVSALCLQPC